MAEEKELYVVCQELLELAEKMAGMKRTAAECCEILDRKAAEMYRQGRSGPAEAPPEGNRALQRKNGRI